jgi:hypothetical protein
MAPNFFRLRAVSFGQEQGLRPSHHLPDRAERLIRAPAHLIALIDTGHVKDFDKIASYIEPWSGRISRTSSYP